MVDAESCRSVCVCGGECGTAIEKSPNRDKGEARSGELIFKPSPSLAFCNMSIQKKGKLSERR
jgi:hypothetical protein